jgi:hypothetical protein
MPDQSLARDPLDEIDERIFLYDRLGLGKEMKGNYTYAEFCRTSPLMVPPDDLRPLWAAMSHLDPTEVREVFHSFLVGKKTERDGVVGMLTAGVPVVYIQACCVDPRLDYSTEKVWGWRDVVDMWEGGVPLDFVDALAPLGHQLGRVVPSAGVVAMTRAGVELGYALECLTSGTAPETIARCWNEGVAVEYAREMV